MRAAAGGTALNAAKQELPFADLTSWSAAVARTTIRCVPALIWEASTRNETTPRVSGTSSVLVAASAAVQIQLDGDDLVGGAALIEGGNLDRLQPGKRNGGSGLRRVTPRSLSPGTVSDAGRGIGAVGTGQAEVRAQQPAGRAPVRASLMGNFIRNASRESVSSAELVEPVDDTSVGCAT